MSQFGGKNDKKTSSDSKRHFTVVRGDEKGGLYISSSPSSAAKKAVTKLCVSNKSKKVEFYIREITQGSKKKTYGPYEGHLEKLKDPIELNGRVIKYKPIAKLSRKIGLKKGGMHRAFGGPVKPPPEICYYRGSEGMIFLRENPKPDSRHAAYYGTKYMNNSPTYLHPDERLEIEETKTDPESGITFVKVETGGISGWVEKEYCRSTPLQTVEQARKSSILHPFKYYSQGDPEYLEREEKHASRPFTSSLPAEPVNRFEGVSAKLKSIPENAQAASSLEAARQLLQNSKKTASRQKLKLLPNIPSNMLNTNNLPGPSAQRHNFRHSFTNGPSSAQRHNFNNNFTTGASSAQRHNFRHSFTNGPSSAYGAPSVHGAHGASSAQRRTMSTMNNNFTKSTSSAYDEFYASVLQRANDRRVEKISDTMYVILYNKNHRVIMELLLTDDGIPYDIKETHQTKP
jgi:hypothetical protein